MYNKEGVYDEKIYPLMDEIIKLCQENNIQMLASFALKDEDEVGENLACTTYLESSEYNIDSILDARNVILDGYMVQKPYIITATITKE